MTQPVEVQVAVMNARGRTKEGGEGVVVMPCNLYLLYCSPRVLGRMWLCSSSQSDFPMEDHYFLHCHMWLKTPSPTLYTSTLVCLGQFFHLLEPSRRGREGSFSCTNLSNKAGYDIDLIRGQQSLKKKKLTCNLNRKRENKETDGTTTLSMFHSNNWIHPETNQSPSKPLASKEKPPNTTHETIRYLSIPNPSMLFNMISPPKYFAYTRLNGRPNPNPASGSTAPDSAMPFHQKRDKQQRRGENMGKMSRVKLRYNKRAG